MKCDVARFIPQDKRAHGFQRLVVNVFSQDAVVGSAYQRCEKHDLKFSANADHSATGAECGETPMRFDLPPTEATDGLAQQARMLSLFCKPKVHQHARF